MECLDALTGFIMVFKNVLPVHVDNENAELTRILGQELNRV